MGDKILVYCWGSLSEPAFIKALDVLGCDHVEFCRKMENYHADAAFAQEFITAVHQTKVDAVFSYDYFPLVSMICEINHIPYISWIYDCAHYTLLSKTLTNRCNYIFCFDRVYTEYLISLGAAHCFHYPLAGDCEMLERCKNVMEASDGNSERKDDRNNDGTKIRLKMAKSAMEEKRCDISFIGSLYNESKNRLRQARLSVSVAETVENLVSAQMDAYGGGTLADSLPESIAGEIMEACSLTLGPEYMQDEQQMAADAIGIEVSARERELVLRSLAKRFLVDLYTGSELPESLQQGSVQNHGYADYATEVPYIFNASRINLNITAKTITSGIPQRVFDILSCGGFCMTNYQPEIKEYFRDGEELVMYTSIEDLLAKTEYYLEHEEERAQIARNGYKKVKEQFSLDVRLKEMLRFCQVNRK